MKKTVNLILALLIGTAGIAQQYFETSTFGDNAIDNTQDHAKDSEGNIYTVGLYLGTITVGGVSITWEGGNADAYLTKHSSDGTPLWVKGFGGFMDDVATAVTVDADDNIYLTGYFMGAGPNSFDADPGPDEFLLMQQSPIASRDCFIIKLDSNADFVWAKQVSNPFGGGANEDSSSIQVDSDGNVYVGGTFALADFNPDPTISLEIFSADDGGSPDPFLLKLDNDGEFVDVKTFDAPSGFAKIESMDLDETGNLYLSGRFQNEVLDLDPNAGTEEFATNGGFDHFMVKLDTDLNYVWGQTFGAEGIDLNEFIKVLPSGVYVGGMIFNGADLDPGTGVSTVSTTNDYDAFFSVFDTDGTYQSSYVVGGDSTQNIEIMHDMVEGPNGNLFAVGTFLATADFDNGTGTAESTSNGNTDNFLVELGTDLSYVNHWTIGGSGPEEQPQIEFNDANEVLTVGTFSSNAIDFNPFEGEDIQNTAGGRDVYFSRYSLDAIAGVEENLFNDVTLFPNPATNRIQLSDRNKVVKEYEIYSILGSRLAYGAAASSIDLSALSSGIYMIKLIGDQVSVTRKIIKN